MTPREAAYVDALQAFFSSTDPGTHSERAGAYETKMSEVYATYLDDPEAAMFYALALLAAADPRDQSYARQYKAAALLNWVRESQPMHPGTLHYLIHAYDNPQLAHLALPAATIYAGAAPDSAHAQHMPSHIFTRLGLWDRSLTSNEDSTQSAAEYTTRAHLEGHYDEGLHSMDYLMYALLQTARDAEEKDLLATLGGIDKTDTENFKVAYTYAASPARYALERRQWDEASELQLIRNDFPWADFGWAQSIHYFARGIGAARGGDVDAARRDLATIERLQAALPATTLPYWKEQVQVHIDTVKAWIAFAEGRTEGALALALRAADLEDAVEKHPVTPGEVLPARELFADMLFEAGRFDEAQTQYEIVLTRAPNRLNALLGAASAAAERGDAAVAEQYGMIVREQTGSGNRAGVTPFERRPPAN
jgi:tetratricopeptide (TPR) repeat protein